MPIFAAADYIISTKPPMGRGAYRTMTAGGPAAPCQNTQDAVYRYASTAACFLSTARMTSRTPIISAMDSGRHICQLRIKPVNM